MIDEDRRVEVLVWLAFMTRARVDTALDEIRAASWLGERYLSRLAVADALGRPLPRELLERGLTGCLQKPTPDTEVGQ